MNLKNSVIATIAGLMLFSAQAMAMTLTEDQARSIVQPFYDFLSNPTDSDVAAAARANFSPEWQSYYSDDGSKGLDETIQAIAGFGKAIPDLHWAIKDLKVAGDTVIVRGEATGTPAGDLFGVPHSGNSFRIMSIDMHTIADGKVVKSYHIEDWAGAIRQLKATK